MSENQNIETKKCKYCQSDIPKKAKVCPQCSKKQGGALKWIIIAFVALAIIAPSSDDEKKVDENRAESVIGTTVSSMESSIVEESITPEPTQAPETEEEFKASCEEYAYKDVLRNPENYVGKRIKITVKISSVHEDSWLNDGKYYFAYSKSDYGWYGDRYGVFDRRDEQTPKLLTDDIITVYGEIADTEHTTSLIVNSSEVFCIDMKFIDFISE